jgi:hypothetical protein
MVVILLSKVRLSVTHVEQGMPKVTNPVAQTCMTANKWRQNPLGLSMSLDHGQFIKPVCGGYTHIHACCDRHMWALGITVHASIDTNNPCRQNHYKTKIQDGVKRLHEQPNGNFPLCLPKKYFFLGLWRNVASCGVFFLGQPTWKFIMNSPNKSRPVHHGRNPVCMCYTHARRKLSWVGHGQQTCPPWCTCPGCRQMPAWCFWVSMDK